ncbi:AI-2E family transporter [Litorivivens sp.]|uniref:AI-2E family transporter n=1 Tax=Litorivivens sp. TaxID=2020868 RepID=UPI0035620DBC
MSNTRLALLIAGAAGIGLLIHLLKPILAPFLVAALLAYLGDPLVDRLEARRMGRTAAVCVVFLVLTLFSLVVLLIALPLLVEQFQLLGVRLQALLQWLQTQVLPELRARLGEGATLTGAGQALGKNIGTAGDVLFRLWNRITGSSMVIMGWLSTLVLIPVVTFYLLRDWDILVAKIRDLLPRNIEGRASLIARECDEILGAFIRGQMLVMAALAVVYTLGLWMVGLELALVLGLLAGLASIVPYMGFVVGIVAAVIAAWFQFHDPWALFQVGVVFTVGQMLEGMVLTPLLVGDRIGLHPVAVIFALLAGAQLFGFVGILLGLPAAAVIMVMLRHVHSSYLGSELYSGPKQPGIITDE